MLGSTSIICWLRNNNNQLVSQYLLQLCEYNEKQTTNSFDGQCYLSKYDFLLGNNVHVLGHHHFQH